MVYQLSFGPRASREERHPRIVNFALQALLYALFEGSLVPSAMLQKRPCSRLWQMGGCASSRLHLN